MKEQDIIEKLRQENEEFRKLSEEHQSFESMLSEMNSKLYLTPDEEVEKRRVQKQKLFGKDKMAEMIREFKKGLPTN